MGDVWFNESGPDRGIYFEDQSDLDKFLERVPKTASEISTKNPILAGIVMNHAEMPIRLASPQEITEFRIREFRQQQQEAMRKNAPRAIQSNLPVWTEAFMLDKAK